MVVTLTQHFERKKQITEGGKIKQPQKKFVYWKNRKNSIPLRPNLSIPPKSEGMTEKGIVILRYYTKFLCDIYDTTHIYSNG